VVKHIWSNAAEQGSITRPKYPDLNFHYFASNSG
jgi:hypothetical protein